MSIGKRSGGMDRRRGAAFFAWTGILIVLVAAAGCNRKPAADGDAPVTITFWHFWRQAYMEPLIAAFEAAHPGIQVEDEQLTWQAGQEKIQAAIAAGNAPNLCELGSTWLPRFAAAGALADLTPVADSLRGELGHWEAATRDGRVYGLPWVVGTRALFWNKSLFRAAGLDTTRGPETWDELLHAATRLSSLPGVKGFGLNAGERYVLFKKFMPFAWGNGGEILTADMTRSAFDSPANAEALDFYVRLAEHSLIEKQDVIDRAFMEGKVGMMLSGAWNLKVFGEEAPGLAFGVDLIPRPAADQGRHASFAGGEYLVTFARSRPREQGPNSIPEAAAIALARFLVRRDNAVALCRDVRSVQPAAFGAEADPYYRDHPQDRVFLEQLKTAVAPPPHPRWGEIEEVLDREIEAALYRRKTAAVAVKDAGAGIDALLTSEAMP
jgi:multiple sugar transport system substrate-binding protein